MNTIMVRDLFEQRTAGFRAEAAADRLARLARAAWTACCGERSALRSLVRALGLLRPGQPAASACSTC